MSVRHRQRQATTTGGRRKALAGVVAGVALSALAFVYLRDEPQPADSGPHLAAVAAEVTWSDEFDGAAGTGPDPQRWQLAVGGQGWGNEELQYYTDRPANAAHDGDGHLVITARRENPAGYECWYGACEYTSARLITLDRFTQTYGRFEARIKIPGGGKGIWPAFWMLGDDILETGWPDSGEIDIMEHIGSAPGTVHGTVHGPGYHGAGGVGETYTLPGGAAFADGFHVFTLDWAPDAITWSVDGVRYSRKTAADLKGGPWVFDHPFFLLLNIAVGGRFPGDPDAGTRLPQQMIVDYVRAYATPGDTSGAAPSTAPTGSPVPATTAPAASAPAVTPSAASASARTNPNPAGTPAPATGTTPAAKPTTAAPTRTSPGTGDGKIIGVASGRCVDVPRGNGADGQYLQIWDCFNTAGQKWTFHSDGTVRALGLCMDVAHGNSANGTTIQLAHCNGTGAQQFVLTSSGLLRNPPSGKCVDAHAWATANGTRLNLWECHGGANQKWRR